MAFQRHRPVARLAPAVRLAAGAAVRVLPGLQVEFGSKPMTQNGGTMSSLKFSYWSSPHTSTKSGLKSSRILRIARKSLPNRSPQRCAAAETVVVAEFGQQLRRPVGRVLDRRIDIGRVQHPGETHPSAARSAGTRSASGCSRAREFPPCPVSSPSRRRSRRHPRLDTGVQSRKIDMPGHDCGSEVDQPFSSTAPSARGRRRAGRTSCRPRPSSG